MFEAAVLLGIGKDNATILQHKVGSRRDDTLFLDLENSTARLPSSRSASFQKVTITYASTPGSSSSVLGSRAGGSGALTPTWLDERGGMSSREETLHRAHALIHQISLRDLGI